MQSVGKSVFDLSHERLHSMGYGQLIPIMLLEVIPDDVFEVNSFIHIQQSPLLAPTKHNINAYIEYYYCPNRNYWTGRDPSTSAETTGDNWLDFITGGEDGTNAATPPYITSANTDRFEKGSLWDHFGLPVGDSAYISGISASALPFRMYNDIYNVHYRNSYIQTTKLPISQRGGADTTTYPSGASTGIAYRNWLGSYFTTSLPNTQRGSEISLPLGDDAPIKGIGYSTTGTWSGSSTNVYETGNTTTTSYADYQVLSAANAFVGRRGLTPATGAPNIYADLTNATSAPINDIRFAVVTQRIKEKMYQLGTNIYKSYLRVFHGVESSDGRIDVPEYLGGGSTPIIVSSVMQTSATDTATSSQTVQGNPVGFGVAGKMTNGFKRRFEEHGFVIALLSVMPQEMYQQGVHPMWSRNSKDDYPIAEYCGLGMQPVYNREVYAAHSSPTGVFGYQYRYNEYRHHMNSVHGMFRDELDYHHIARKFTSDPSLNDAFLKCSDSTNLRIHAVQNEDPLWVSVKNNVTAIRRLTKNSISSIDAFTL